MISFRAIVEVVCGVRKNPVAREFTWLSLGSQLTGVLSLLALLVLARTVSVERLGEVVFAQAAAGVTLLVLDVRFDDAVQRFFPIVKSSSEVSARAFFWRMVRFDGAFGLLIVVVAAALWLLDFLPSSGIADPNLLVLALMSAGLGSAVGTLNAGFAVNGALEQLGKLSTLVAVVANSAIVVGAALGGGVGFLLGTLLGVGIQLVLLLWACHQVMPPVDGNSKAELPDNFGRFLLKSSLATSFSLGTESGILTVAGVVGGPTVVALLRIAQAPGRLLQSVFSAIAVQAFPRLAVLAAARDATGIVGITGRITRMALVGGCVLVLPVIFFLGSAIEVLYGAAYVSATAAASLYLIAAIFRVGGMWSKVLPAAVGRPGIRLAVVSVEGALSLIGTATIALLVADPAKAATLVAGQGLTLSFLLLIFWVTVVRRADLIGPVRSERKVHNR